MNEFALYLFFFSVFIDKAETAQPTRLFGWILAEKVKAQWSALVRGILYVGNSAQTHAHTYPYTARACL